MAHDVHSQTIRMYEAFKDFGSLAAPKHRKDELERRSGMN